MADQKRTDADRTSQATDVATGLSGSATPAGGIDPATSTLSAKPGTYTGRVMLERDGRPPRERTVTIELRG